MKTETSKDVLADGVRDVVDAETLRAWVEGPLRAVVPHDAMLCGQSVAHSGGYAAILKLGFGLPMDYEAAIACEGGNVRSPILTRLMHSGGPEFFDVERDDGADIDATWRANFRRAGWRNLLGLAHREGEGDRAVFTSAGFYNVSPASAANARALQQAVMPHVHEALSRIYRYRCLASTPALQSEPLTPVERAVVALVLQGKSNKEIGRALGRSDETVKKRLGVLMRRLNVRNRTQLALLIASKGELDDGAL